MSAPVSEEVRTIFRKSPEELAVALYKGNRTCFVLVTSSAEAARRPGDDNGSCRCYSYRRDAGFSLVAVHGPFSPDPTKWPARLWDLDMTPIDAVVTAEGTTRIVDGDLTFFPRG